MIASTVLSRMRSRKTLAIVESTDWIITTYISAGRIAPSIFSMSKRRRSIAWRCLIFMRSDDTTSKLCIFGSEKHEQSWKCLARTRM